MFEFLNYIYWKEQIRHKANQQKKKRTNLESKGGAEWKSGYLYFHDFVESSYPLMWAVFLIPVRGPKWSVKSVHFQIYTGRNYTLVKIILY